MKLFTKFICSLLVMFVINALMGSVFAQSLGIDSKIGSAVLIAAGCLSFLPVNVAMEGVYVD